MLLRISIPVEEYYGSLLSPFSEWYRKMEFTSDGDVWRYVEDLLPYHFLLVEMGDFHCTFFILDEDEKEISPELDTIPLNITRSRFWSDDPDPAWISQDAVDPLREMLKGENIPEDKLMGMISEFLLDAGYLIEEYGRIRYRVVASGRKVTTEDGKEKRYVLIGYESATPRPLQLKETARQIGTLDLSNVTINVLLQTME